MSKYSSETFCFGKYDLDLTGRQSGCILEVFYLYLLSVLAVKVNTWLLPQCCENRMLHPVLRFLQGSLVQARLSWSRHGLAGLKRAAAFSFHLPFAVFDVG